MTPVKGEMGKGAVPSSPEDVRISFARASSVMRAWFARAPAAAQQSLTGRPAVQAPGASSRTGSDSKQCTAPRATRPAASPSALREQQPHAPPDAAPVHKQLYAWAAV